jgi:hypothetical protein
MLIHTSQKHRIVIQHTPFLAQLSWDLLKNQHRAPGSS